MDVKQQQISDNSQVTHFNLRFERTFVAYYSGEIIQGFLDIDGKTRSDVNEIVLTFRGESLACWNDDDKPSDQNTIRAHKCHWKEEIFLLKKEESSSPIENRNGIFSYPFKVQLPSKDLPSSFESKFGAVRYWVKASLQPSSKSCQQPFTVLERINVNHKNYQKKVSGFDEKMLSWMCFKYGGISLNASIDRSAYCPGEAVAVSCRGNNKANKELGGIKARLVQNIRYSSPTDNQYKDYEIILRAIGGNKIAQGSTKVWENQLLWIPAIPPTNRNSGNITVTYHIQVSMQIPNDADLEVQLPVTIGTVPWKNNNNCSTASDPPMNHAKFEKCTDGSDCFNRSSKRYQFPMHPFIPSTLMVKDYEFRQFDRNNGNATRKTKFCDDERKPLLQKYS